MTLMQSPMIAYHNNPQIKSAILAQLAMHREADEIVKGKYWQNGKGCAVGCTIHSSNHFEYEAKFGIPVVLARLEDGIFEGLPNGSAKEWPEQFMGAIGVGRDLSMVWPQFALWLLTVELDTTGKKHRALASVSALYREWCAGSKPERQRWLIAKEAAYVAAANANAAADFAADSADSVAAAYAAGKAADAADAADRAAAAAAAAAAASVSAAAATSAYARENSYVRQAKKLIEIIKAA